MKFRNCFFEYDGVYSGKYNLRLVYVENSNHNFDSGGGFDFKFGQIPYYHEQLYYGKDYSANPLQFEIEVLNVDGYISETQMIEIKEWLFGGSGWKKFKPLNGTNNKSLRCILTPITDITEGNHYKGLRFNLRNASPFWYGEEKEDTHNNSWNYSATLAKNFHHYLVDIQNNDYVDCELFPIIVIEYDRSKSDIVFDYGKQIIIENTTAKTVTQAVTVKDSQFVYPTTSRIQIDTSYIDNNAEVITYQSILNTDDNKYYIQLTLLDGDKQIPTDMATQLSQEQINNLLITQGYHSLSYNSENASGTAIYAKDTIIIDTRYVTARSVNYPNADIHFLFNADDPKNGFRLHYGVNICRVSYPWAFDSITFKYTPLYRMGAF